MGIKEFLNKPIKEVFKKDDRIKHDARIILNSDLLNDKQKRLFKKTLARAGINIEEGFSHTNHWDIFGIMILWALLLCFIIVSILIMKKILNGG